MNFPITRNPTYLIFMYLVPFVIPPMIMKILLTALDSEQFSSGPGPQLLTPETISSGLVPNLPSPTPYVPPTKKDWDILFQPMFDKYFSPPPSVVSLVPAVGAPVPADLTDSPSLTLVDQDEPYPSTSQTPQ
ncbi:hypothetical protein Tco_1257966 [Tanacetum coccineum]